MVPQLRITGCNQSAARSDGDYVLYWMIAFRRTQWNFSLQRAVEWAVELRKPLLIFEPLRIGYPWACDRFHRFVIDGMADNAGHVASLRNAGVRYYPYVEPHTDADKGLFASLADRACVVVTDEYPSFFLPRMIAAAAARIAVRMEQVDSNGLLPLRAADKVFSTALSFRSFLQKHLPEHLAEFPQADPLQGIDLPVMPDLPQQLIQRWPPASAELLAGDSAELDSLGINHAIAAAEQRGGPRAARQHSQSFFSDHLEEYDTAANQPQANARSRLSPYLHFGHVSAHELFNQMASQQDWSPAALGQQTAGKRQGWWGMSPGAEAWLDQLVTWRELGFNMSSLSSDYDQYDSLPQWSRATLDRHARDRREHVYSLDEFAAAATHDPLWNAAQTQLLREGYIHNYLRMLWGKKILEWTDSPPRALEYMIELNNRYALDGRDPNSYSGIFWCLGRYDRPWGPERPIFGTVRYMSSQNTQRKLRVSEYLQQYSSTPG